MRTHVVTAVVATLIVALAVWSLLMWGTMQLGRSAYENGDYEAAERRFATASRITPLEPWRPAFGEGTALLAQGRTESGIIRLEDALDKAPKADEIDGVKDPNSYECIVRANLYLGYAEAGRVEDATAVIDTCPNPDPTAVSAESEDEEGEEPEAAEPTEEPDPQLEELEERNEDSRRQRQDEMEWSGGGGSGQNW